MKKCNEGFATVGFIKLGYVYWSKIKLANEYRTNLHGYVSKLYQSVKFKLKGK